ncbi:MAG TPA: glycosyltransferase family 4 protein [Marinilabiliaceae bacterium]|nr:glycosyltransferase family 4 protein [Marinilabiliaceae bacterium]
MSKIRILFTIPNFKTAGSQYVLLSLYRRIDKTVFDPFICVERFPETIPDDIPLHRQLTFAWTGSNFQDVKKFKNLLNQHQIDILHSWDYKSNYLEALATRSANVKYVYTKKNNAWSKRWKLKSLLSSHIAYDNPDMKERFFASWLFRNKIAFIPHGVDTALFEPLEAEERENFNLICIGNINANKNQLLLLKALRQLPERVVLYLYGKEEAHYRKQLDNYIIANNLTSRVFFNSYVINSNIPKILASMDLFVLPSLQEGLPVSILEALSCGVPVLSSNSGGGAKYIVSKGGGLIFEVDKTESLVSHVRRLLQNPEELKLLSQKGRANVVNNFSLKFEIEAYEKLYKKIVQ